MKAESQPAPPHTLEDYKALAPHQAGSACLTLPAAPWRGLEGGLFSPFDGEGPGARGGDRAMCPRPKCGPPPAGGWWSLGTPSPSTWTIQKATVPPLRLRQGDTGEGMWGSLRPSSFPGLRTGAPKPYYSPQLPGTKWVATSPNAAPNPDHGGSQPPTPSQCSPCSSPHGAPIPSPSTQSLC